MTDAVEPLSLIRTGDQLDAKVFPPLAWAVHSLIPEGMGLFTGAPKTGKSWAALDVALAVASGTNALGKVPTGNSRPVLLLAMEDGERRLQGRCRHLLGDNASIPRNLHYLTSTGGVSITELIGSWLDQHGDTNPLIILDTLGKVMPRALPGEGAYDRDYRIGSTLKALVDAHPGSTLLVVHHIRKASGDDWMDSTSGTNGLNGAADFTLNLSRSRNDDAGVLRVTGRDVPENEYAITNRNGRWEIDGTELADAARKALAERQKANLGDDSAAVVEYVNDHPDGVRAADVAAELDMDPDKARVYLNRLHKAEKIERTSRGLYGPPVTSVTTVTSVWEEPPERNSRNGCNTPSMCTNTNCQTFNQCTQETAS